MHFFMNIMKIKTYKNKLGWRIIYRIDLLQGPFKYGNLSVQLKCISIYKNYIYMQHFPVTSVLKEMEISMYWELYCSPAENHISWAGIRTFCFWKASYGSVSLKLVKTSATFVHRSGLPSGQDFNQIAL